MALRTLFLVPLGAILACGPAVALPGSDDSSTGDVPPPGGSTGPSQTSSVPPNPTSPPNPDPPPQTTTDPFDPTSGGLEGTGSSGGCAFLCDTTGSITPECDLFEQNCPEGEKCAPWANDGGSAWNATRCAPIAEDPDQPGEPCTVEGSAVSGIDSCDLGSMCWNVNTESGMGTCMSHCIGSPQAPSCADPDNVCRIGGDGSLTLCLPTCDPLMDDCPDGEGCYPSYDVTFFCAPDGSGDGGAVFDGCDFVNGCDPGNVCANPTSSQACDKGDGAGCCLPWCDLSAPDCPGDTICLPWFEKGSEPPGGEFLGFCADAP